jgi:membrane-associated phospholipid phosphatase
VGQREASLFRAVNGLPDGLYRPAWTIMQCGALGAVVVAAGAARAAGDRELAWRLAASGLGTWALAKLVKRKVRRPRPASLLVGTRTRGPEASGLGYLSGHAGVATALCASALGRLPPPGRGLAMAVVPVVGLSRVYVGAHLPLDIVGGASLGLTVEAAVALAQRHCDR